MKKSLLLVLFAIGLGFTCASAWFKQSLKQQQDGFSKQQAEWLAEKSALEAALSEASGRVTTLPGETHTRIVEITRKVSPAEILERLKQMKVTADQPRSGRLLGHELENLIACGPPALPDIREFLAGNEDVNYDLSGFIKSARGGKLPTEFTVPPSLRFGLFEALKDIGGADAEKILAEALVSTGRGLEVAYLARVLEQLAPGQYRAAALQAAHGLLASTADKDDRNFLFATLTLFNDPTFAVQAQAQLIQPDGKVDAAALKYLQQAQPGKALAIALQAYQDPRITDAGAKERLAQVALDTAGTDPLADRFFYAAMGDVSLPADNRRNLAEDFADHGTNPKNPSAQDILVMQKRLALLEQLRVEATEPRVIAGISEAQKDLTKFISTYLAQHPQP